MADFQINGRTFRNQTSYEAGLRDQKRIERIEEKASSMNLSEKKELLIKMRNDVFRFESALGEDYIDTFEEMIEEEESALNAPKGKIIRFRKPKSDDNDTIKNRKANSDDNDTIKNRQSNLDDINIIKNRKTKSGDIDTINHRKTNSKDIVTLKNRKKNPKDTAAAQNKKGIKVPKKKLEEYDKDMQKIILEEMKKNDIRRKFVMLAAGFVGVSCMSLFFLRMMNEQKNETIYDELVAQKAENEPVSSSVNRKSEVHLTEEGEVELTILPEYESLYEKNENLIGWLKIADTNIDYPVMKATDRTYYLTHGFDEEYDRNGSIFMDPDCNVVKRSTNIILYGHHMHTGKMFGNLDKYKDFSYYQEHPVIEFDTIYERGTYEIIYAFNSQVFYEDEITFKYYQFIDAVSQEAFYSNCEEMAKMSFYDTGIKPGYGDSLLTLSTCDKSESEQGRFVVVARKIN